MKGFAVFLAVLFLFLFASNYALVISNSNPADKAELEDDATNNEPWFDIFIEKTALLMFTRFPGEFTLKWTKVMLASNANIRMVFEEIRLIDEHNNELPAVFGFKQGENEVQWQTGQWEMFFEHPLQVQEFELWLKITADTKVSVGDYKGIIKAHVLIEE